MYLSLLHVNVNNRPGRQWLGDLYRIHQRLWMAFPDSQQVADDPFFLGSWGGSPATKSKAKRDKAGFLFRVERDGPARILVQSTNRPDWEYAFQNAPYLLASAGRVREFAPAPRKEERYRFRFLAHVVDRHSVATEKTRTTKSGKTIPKRKRKEIWVHPAAMPDPLPADPTGRLRVCSVRWDSWRDWLRNIGDDHGFQVIDNKDTPLLVQPLRAVVRNPKQTDPTRYNAGMFDGVLTCVDSGKLRNAIINGIGPAKAFGFGLLSIAPVK